MELTAIPIGNSAGVIIPAKLRSQVGLQVGGKVFASVGSNGNSLILSVGKKNVTSSITPDFLEVVNRINKRYYSLFTSLAKK